MKRSSEGKETVFNERLIMKRRTNGKIDRKVSFI